MSAEINRRHFLKLGVTLAAGLASGALLLPVSSSVTSEVEKLSGKPTGNASVKVSAKTKCEDAEDEKKCIDEYAHSNELKFVAVVEAPLVEEAINRAAPSLLLSKWEGAKDPIEDTLRGTGGFTMTRREIVSGIATSLFFGGVHNITDKGFDTNTIPASQTVGGFSFWYLQRKFGIMANMTAHAFHNFLALR